MEQNVGRYSGIYNRGWMSVSESNIEVDEWSDQRSKK